MEYNIVEKYIKFLTKEFSNFFKIILKDKYSKKICDSFISKYINVRYYDETDYPQEKDFITRTNKEFRSLYKELKNDNNDELLKNIFALFGYLICFDDTESFVEEISIIDTLLKDENIKIKRNNEIEIQLKSWLKNLKAKKDEFNNSIVSNDFTLNEHRLCKNTFKLELMHNVKVSNLYSEYAINKIYNSGLIYEERMFITYIQSAYQALENARNVDFSKKYVVDFPSTLFDKPKKTQRLLNVINNTLCKKTISMMITYNDYLNYSKIIEKYIQEGYSFGIILDESYDFDTTNLVIFDYVFIYQNYEFYDMILSEKNKLNTKLVVL